MCSALRTHSMHAMKDSAQYESSSICSARCAAPSSGSPPAPSSPSALHREFLCAYICTCTPTHTMQDSAHYESSLICSARCAAPSLGSPPAPSSPSALHREFLCAQICTCTLTHTMQDSAHYESSSIKISTTGCALIRLSSCSVISFFALISCWLSSAQAPTVCHQGFAGSESSLTVRSFTRSHAVSQCLSLRSFRPSATAPVSPPCTTALHTNLRVLGMDMAGSWHPACSVHPLLWCRTHHPLLQCAGTHRTQYVVADCTSIQYVLAR